MLRFQLCLRFCCSHNSVLKFSWTQFCSAKILYCTIFFRPSHDRTTYLRESKDGWLISVKLYRRQVDCIVLIKLNSLSVHLVFFTEIKTVASLPIFVATRIILRSDRRASRKAELGRYLSAMDWSVLFSSIDKCKDLINVFKNVISTGLDLLVPV